MTPDGVRIRAYLIIFDEAPHERPTVLMLHANAGNVGDRLSISRIFRQRMRCNVLALSYRGYGKSEGTANENGIRLDAQTALDYILSHPQLDKTAIFLYGQSIGGAVAIDLASRNAQRIAGLIVENTFLSLPQLVSHLMPYLRPFLPLLLNQIWPSVDKVAAFPDSLSVCFLSGSKDDLIPPSHMNELHRLSGGKKEIHRFPEGTHSECFRTTFDLANSIRRHLRTAGLLSDHCHLHLIRHQSRGRRALCPLESDVPCSTALGSLDGALLDGRLVRAHRRRVGGGRARERAQHRRHWRHRQRGRAGEGARSGGEAGKAVGAVKGL